MNLKYFKHNISKNIKAVEYKKAFTLIEILVVVAIISLISALVVNSLSEARMKSNDEKIAQDLSQFRTAVDMYFNDNQEYPVNPALSTNYKYSETAHTGTDFWGNKLAFFTKKASAAVNHTISPLCANFDNISALLVQRKYLSAIPVHPYDNDAQGICYKAVSGTNVKTFSAYGILATKGTLADGYVVSRRTGFISGDTSRVGVEDLYNTTKSIDSDEEIKYPAGTDAAATNPFESVTSNTIVTIDKVLGLTSGVANGSCASRGMVYDTTTKSCKTLYTGDRIASAFCRVTEIADPYSDNCIMNPVFAGGGTLLTGGPGGACLDSHSFPDVFGNCVSSPNVPFTAWQWDPTAPPCDPATEAEEGGYCYPCKSLIEGGYTPLPTACNNFTGSSSLGGSSLGGSSLGGSSLGGTGTLYGDPGGSPFMPGGNMIP